MALEKEVYDKGRISLMLEDRIIDLEDELEDFQKEEIRQIKDGLNEFSAYPYVVETFMEGITKIGYHNKSTRWDGSTENNYIDYLEIPSIGSIENLAKLTELDIEIMKEMFTGKYCTAWFYDEPQGSPYEKALKLVLDEDYTLYDSVKEYEENRDQIIKEEIEDHDLESEEDIEEAREELISKSEEYAIYLSTGQVCYINLSIWDTLNDVLS